MLILHGITSGWKPLKDGLEIKWHNEALLWILEVVKWEYPITEVFIRELNKKILGDPYEIDAITPDWIPTKRRITPWEYKTQPNHVKTKTGELFRFAEPFETPAKMEDLINWFRWEKDKKDIDPILTAIEFHYRFIRIHPFDDGNGRTARILMNFILMQYGYPPAIIKTEEKDWYYSALRQADTGDLLAFFEYITREVIHSLDIMLRGANGENIDDEDDIDKEIRLLKWELSWKKNRKFWSRAEKLNHWINNTIIPFFKLIDKDADEFNDFYDWWKHWIVTLIYSDDIKSEFYLWKSKFSFKEKDIRAELKMINFEISYVDLLLNKKWIYLIHIDIEFSETYFLIKITSSISSKELFSIQKWYSDILSESEQKEILRLIKQDHLNFIKSHKN